MISITQLFNQNNIDYVVLKGMAIKIKKLILIVNLEI